MSQLHDNIKNDIKDNNEITISVANSFDDTIDTALLSTFYTQEKIQTTLAATLMYIDKQLKNGLALPYFLDIDTELWYGKPKALDVYITDNSEGRALNLEARGKDYATNILSYPSALPATVLRLMPTLLLGELIICHEVVIYEAAEQNKTIEQHISHLLIHGVLHLLGFDHEIGQVEQDEMERFEIDILAGMDLPNPYF